MFRFFASLFQKKASPTRENIITRTKDRGITASQVQNLSQDVFDLLVQELEKIEASEAAIKAPRKMAFILGSQVNGSSVSQFFAHPLFDSNVVKLIFPFSESIQKTPIDLEKLEQQAIANAVYDPNFR